MDDKDRLLLSLLRRDARQSTVALARALGLSRSATQERLARLERSGAIAGYTLVEGAAAPRAAAWLQLRFASGQACAQVVPRLKRIPAVVLIHSLAGETDLLLRVEGADVAAVEQARAEVAATAGVAAVTTQVVLERHLG